ncbi:MAG TPA: hypothetical protein PLD87_11970 [Bacteroidia bacterium]|nr:hypothetical protein [Bacteroidia bacterium]
MKKIFSAAIILSSFFTYNYTNAQGCSDAGFCTIGALNPQIIADTLGDERYLKNNFHLSPTFALGEQGVSIWQYTPEVNLTLVKGLMWQAKMPYVYAYGNLGSNYGIGDVSTSLTYTHFFKKTTSLAVTLGSKIPTHDAGTCENGIPLPMPYQRSLGTYDGILGVKFMYKTWNFSAGYQMVLANKNENGFLASRWTGDDDAQQYFVSNKLNRGDDMLLRAEKVFIVKKLNLSAGLLGIYRLTKDKYTDASGTDQELNGSSGLTLNITGSATYVFTPKSSFGMNFGFPVLVRETRADGLTRSMVVSLVYQINFNLKK